MQLAPEVCERARMARDSRFDGRFFVAVKTTGIYCRPICPAPTARAKNVEYYTRAAAAQEAGFRPCLRCCPEAAPGSPAWRGTEVTVGRALRMIDEGALDEISVDDLAAKLGVGERHLRRLFVQHLGAAPLSFARTRRVHLAKTLIDQTDMSMAQVAMVSGFGSVRQFNTVMRSVYERSPRELRRRRGCEGDAAGGLYLLRIPFREPFDWEGLLEFFALRAIPGVEQIDGLCYRRTHAHGGLEVTAGDGQLTLRIQTEEPRAIPDLVMRVRRLFDLAAVPEEISAVLSTDPRLPRIPGLRLPGAYDGFEVAVRAILGQQVTVKGATTIAGRLVERYGETVAAAPGRLFPSPEVLASAELDGLGMPGARGRAVRDLARAVVRGELHLDDTCDLEAMRKSLRSLPGIGEWTTEYIAMRVLGDPDAFPAGDLALRKALVPGELVTVRELREASAAWRPWRAYAALMLWRSLACVGGG